MANSNESNEVFKPSEYKFPDCVVGIRQSSQILLKFPVNLFKFDGIIVQLVMAVFTIESVAPAVEQPLKLQSQLPIGYFIMIFLYLFLFIFFSNYIRELRSPRILDLEKNAF